MEIQLTGNPFVDTGLGVVAHLAGCKDIHRLSFEDLVKVHGDGRTLARKNSKLKSMTMVFSNNSLATNPAIKSQEKRIEYYSVLTTSILASIGKEDLAERCESCGNERSLDVDLLVRRTLVPLGFNDSIRHIGRDWFPLAGSMGSDAQALPVASRAPNICAKCLFAVHYLPLGVLLVNGRLAVFQSTSTTFWFNLIKEISEEIDNRVRAKVYDTLGAKEGSTSAASRLFKIMKDMEYDELDPETTLFVWLFSNSGTAPDCSIDEIPNSALKFIHNATKIVNFNEIGSLLNHDRKRSPEFSLLGCISRGVDYGPLYPYRDYPGVSNELFVTYQVLVRNVQISRLHVAHKITCYVKDVINDSKALERLRKDIVKEFSAQNTIRKIVADMIQKGLLTYDECSSLFLDFQSQYLKIDYDAWKFLQFYFSKDSVKFPTTLGEHVLDPNIPVQKPEYYRQLHYVAAKILEIFKEEKGAEKIPVLISSIARKDTKPAWLQMQFIKLSDKYEGFTYSDWAALCIGENGRDISWEVLTQLRLIWTDWIRRGAIPTIVQLKTNESQGMQDRYESLASKLVAYYLEKHGEERLRKYVFEGLRRKELGLYWFREQLSKIDPNFNDDDYWETFLQDEGGKRVPSTRLFQLHLSIRNVLKQHPFKDAKSLS